MSVKRQLNHTLQSQEQYDHQYDLQALGMRIRQSVALGYQNKPQGPVQEVQQVQEQSQFQRVPLPASVMSPPSLSFSNSSFSTFGSNLEEWDHNLNQRLDTIDEQMQKDASFSIKRSFAEVDF